MKPQPKQPAEEPGCNQLHKGDTLEENPQPEPLSEAAIRYQAAGHAIQSGVLFDQQTGSDSSSPKHLRTGIDLRAADQAGLANLLIAKGVFTRQEYVEAMADAAEDEQKRYEEYLSKKVGKVITLG
jgi:hypothetical protein